MKRILLISTLLTFFMGNNSFAQCGANEVEVRVNILTDAWGEETSWTLTNLLGAVIMQGGQGGVYGDYTSYSDSICVSDDSCLVFKIYDTWGDGIFAPGVYSGSY